MSRQRGTVCPGQLTSVETSEQTAHRDTGSQSIGIDLSESPPITAWTSGRLWESTSSEIMSGPAGSGWMIRWIDFNRETNLISGCGLHCISYVLCF